MSFSGFPTVRLNLFNVVLTLDLSQTSSFTFMAGPMANMIERGIPLRFGLVPIVEGSEGKKMARLFYHLMKDHGRKKTLAFVQNVSLVAFAIMGWCPHNFIACRCTWDDRRCCAMEDC
jgi:hypothetical protein